MKIFPTSFLENFSGVGVAPREVFPFLGRSEVERHQREQSA